MIRLILYAVFMACCYLTVQQCKTALYAGMTSSTTSTAASTLQQQQQQQSYPVAVFGSAFIGGETRTATSRNEKGISSRPDETEEFTRSRRDHRPPLRQQPRIIIGKNGMLLNDPWRKRLANQNHSSQRQQHGYAPTGGALPASPTFSTHYHESMWSNIDNGTCLVSDNVDVDTDDDSSSSSNSIGMNKNSNPVYGWQLRAPYVILLGTMKGGTQALTSYLWQHPRFAPKDFGYEMHFFDQQDFIRNNTGIPRRVNQQTYAQRFVQSHKKFLLMESMRQRQEIQQEQQKLQEQEEQVNHHTNSTRNNTNPNYNNSSTRKRHERLLNVSVSYAVDSSPYYLLASDRIPDAILCVAPWAQWLAILRNPIARVESHFRHLHQARFENNNKMVDWHIWIQDDIRLLTNAGVLLPRHVAYIWNNTTNDNTSISTSPSWDDTLQAEFDAYSGSANEMQAWKRYNRSPSSQQIVGRGLYAIQIGHYIAALQRFHNSNNSVANNKRQPRPQHSHPGNTSSSTNEDEDDDDFQQFLTKKLLVITSEDLSAHTQDVYNRVLEFLHLPKHVLMDTRKVHASDTSNLPDIKMPLDIRMQLKRLYEPYNQRLYQLLKWNTTNTIWQ